MSERMARVAILGRPNVGKSTLFNRLTRSRRALVHDTPGVTRDRLDGDARIGTLRFAVTDTAGLETGREDLSQRLRAQSLLGLETSDLGLFLIDARSGITPLDEEIAALLRAQDKPILLLANKCEGRTAEALAQEAWSLGLGEPIPISAEHNEGLLDLADAMRPFIDSQQDPDDEAQTEDVDSDDPSRPIRMAIVGRPNVGKSSLVNKLIEEERLLTGPEPGLTRDAVDIAWQWNGRPLQLVDTAGLRKKARIDKRLEQISASATVNAIRRAHVVILLVDANDPLEKQDLAIANLAIDEGRALAIAANKWDLVQDHAEAMRELRERVTYRLSQVKGLRIMPISVKTGKNLDKLPEIVLETHDRWNTRVPTSAINRWLQDATDQHPPPMVQNRAVKFRYATQTAKRPPTITLFANKPADTLTGSYLRYLETSFREAFDLPGIPLRFNIRHGANPYHSD